MVVDLGHSQTHLTDLKLQKCHFNETVLCTDLLRDHWELNKSVEIWLEHVHDLPEPSFWAPKIEKIIILERTTYPQGTRIIFDYETVLCTGQGGDGCEFSKSVKISHGDHSVFPELSSVLAKIQRRSRFYPAKVPEFQLESSLWHFLSESRWFCV